MFSHNIDCGDISLTGKVAEITADISRIISSHSKDSRVCLPKEYSAVYDNSFGVCWRDLFVMYYL